MSSARPLRVFNLYDILGVFIPGTVLLLGFLLLFATPPIPTAPWEYLLYGVVSLSFGYVVQWFASRATGKRRIFENTIDEVRSPLEEGLVADDEAQSKEAESSHQGSQLFDLDLDSDDETYVIVVFKLFRQPSRWFHSQVASFIRILSHAVYAIIGPLVWWRWAPEAESIGDLLHTNRVWRDVRDTYRLDVDTDNYEQLHRMISSEVDDVESPSRSYRFQAIRNFHRGMWVSVWFVTLVIIGHVTALVVPIYSFLEIPYQEPYLLAYFSYRVVFLVAVCSLFVFWRLTIEYQRRYVMYLIVDYFVILRRRELRAEMDEE